MCMLQAASHGASDAPRKQMVQSPAAGTADGDFGCSDDLFDLELQLDLLGHKLLLQVSVAELAVRTRSEGEEGAARRAQHGVGRASRQEVDAKIGELFDASWLEEARGASLPASAPPHGARVAAVAKGVRRASLRHADCEVRAGDRSRDVLSEEGLDLVLISPEAKPPVARIERNLALG